MFIINPDPYSLPCYRIGPFQTRDLSLNHILPDSNLIDDYFHDRFAGKDFIYTENGRKAINLALSFYNLEANDVVTILTTTGNFYISGCVTKEIEKFCKWSREIVDETKVIFVNHEFGIPYPDLRKLLDYKLPIIEDCANTFFSQDKNKEVGKIGDFVIYSFPKMFPLQIGGLLVSNLKNAIKNENAISSEVLRHTRNVLSSQIHRREKIISDRLSNYSILKSKFETLGFKERFKIEPDVIPGVFMFRAENKKLNLPELKKHFYAHGLQCSVFYGEESFFLPCHQSLSEQDIQYFYEVMKSFIKEIES